MTADQAGAAQLPDVLPEGWVEATLPELVGPLGLFSDGDWIESKDQDQNGDVRLIQLADIGDGEYRNRSSRFLTAEKAKDLACTFLARGDILVARMPEPLARACIFPGDPKPSVTAVDVCVVRPQKDGADVRWLLHTINSAQFRNMVTEYERGTTRKRISRANLGRIPIPVPPLIEQKRIVAKVEELLARVNAARERLARVPAILKRFRQAVLAAACSGRLTADWRQDHPEVSSPDSFLHDLLRRRRILCARPSGGHVEPIVPDHSEYEDVPSSWVLATMDQLTFLVTSGSRGWAKYYADSGAIFIRAQDINTDELRLDNVAHVKPPNGAEGERTRVRYGDLLITITGANVTKSAPVNVELEETYVSQHVALVRPTVPEILSYLHLWTISPLHGRARLLADAYGAGKPGLNLDNIRHLPVALPPLEEQLEIETRVGKLLGLADTIDAFVKIGAAKEEKLTQAILAKAFRGELVLTEAELARAEGRSYEPASTLFARIRSLQAAEPVVGRRTKGAKGTRGWRQDA